MVLFINSDQLRQQEKIIAGYFQLTKRNVKHFPRLINVVGMMIVSEFISRLFFVWREHFVGVFIFADGESLCFVRKRLGPSLHDY